MKWKQKTRWSILSNILIKIWKIWNKNTHFINTTFYFTRHLYDNSAPLFRKMKRNRNNYHTHFTYKSNLEQRNAIHALRQMDIQFKKPRFLINKENQTAIASFPIKSSQNNKQKWQQLEFYFTFCSISGTLSTFRFTSLFLMSHKKIKS